MTQHQTTHKSDQTKQNGQTTQKAPPVKVPAPAESMIALDTTRPLSPTDILHLQRTIGNRATSQIVQRQTTLAQQQQIRRKKSSKHNIQRTPNGEIIDENQQSQYAAAESETEIASVHAGRAPHKTTTVQRTAEDEEITEYNATPIAETAAPSHGIHHRVDRTPEEEREQGSSQLDYAALMEHMGNMPAMPESGMMAQNAGVIGGVQRAPTFANTYTGDDQAKAQQALDWAKEDSAKSTGDRFGDAGKDFGTGLVGALGGPLVYAIPAKRQKLKEDWAKADNVLAYGTGGWGKFVTGAKRTNIVLGEIANFIGWVSLLCMIAAPFTAGASAVPGAALSVAAGAINAIMGVLNLVIIIGQAVRISQLPENSIERALAWRALIDESAQLVANAIGAGLGLSGAGGVSKAAGDFAGKSVGKGLAKVAADVGINTAISAGTNLANVGANTGSHKIGKDQVQPATDPVEMEAQLTKIEGLGTDMAGDSSQFSESAKKAEDQFQSMDAKAGEAPVGKLAAVENAGASIGALPAKASNAATSVGDDKGKIKSMQQKVDAAGQKVGVSVQISTPEPSEDEFKAAKTGGQANRMPDVSRMPTEMPVQRFFGKIKSAFKKVGSAISGAASKVWSGVKAGASAVADFAKKAFNKVKQWVTAAIKAIINAVLAIVKKLIAAFKALVAKIKAFIQKIKDVIQILKGQKAQSKQATALHAENQQKSADLNTQIKSAVSQVKASRTSKDKDSAA